VGNVPGFGKKTQMLIRQQRPKVLFDAQPTSVIFWTATDSFQQQRKLRGDYCWEIS
jgi:hypothetical protein